MLHQHERVALAGWWRDHGRHYAEGGLSVLIPAVVVTGLILGFTVN